MYHAITVKGVSVPSDSNLIMMEFSVGRNPDVLPQANKFMPDRFDGMKSRHENFEIFNLLDQAR